MYPSIRNFFRIGKTLKSHGTTGQIRLMVEDRLRSYLQPGSFIFFDLDGSKVPFKIIATEDGQHFLINFQDVENKEISDRLSGKELWIPLDQVKTRHLKSPKNINEKWEQYRICDEASNVLYDIKRTEEYPQQLMAVIEIDGKESLIPLHDQLITDIDMKGKVIRMNIPEGLLDL